MLSFPAALLEDWMRHYYFETEIDIGSSGVEDFALGELSGLLDFSVQDLERLVFHDSRTLGGPGLRQAIADRWLHGDSDRVMATHGSTEATFLTMAALLSSGDEVLVCDPCYQQLHSTAATLGCSIRRWPLRFERGYRPDLDELESLVNDRTRMVVVNFPHNPTGASLSREEQLRLIGIVERVGAYLVWDGAFAELVYDSAPLPEVGLLYEKGVSFGTLSKVYGLPGLRVGWCLAAPGLLEKMVRVRDYVTLHLSPLVELIAERAVRHADRLVALRFEQAKRNLEIVAGWAASEDGRVGWVRPAGGVTAFPRLPMPDTEPLCRRLAEDHKVLLVPGSCFGHPAHVRLGFGGASAQLERGLAHLSSLLRSGAPDCSG